MTEAELAKLSDEDKIHAIADALDLPKSCEDMDDGTICQEQPHKMLMEWNPLADANARDEVEDVMVGKGWSICTITDSGRSLVTVQREGVVYDWSAAPDRGTALINACLLAIGE